jgi:hypothetical protein
MLMSAAPLLILAGPESTVLTMLVLPAQVLARHRHRHRLRQRRPGTISQRCCEDPHSCRILHYFTLGERLS